MTNESEIQAVVTLYLEGMIYGQYDLLRRAMHPLCMQAGNYNNEFEFMPRDEFIEAIKSYPKEPEGSPINFAIKMIDITGDIAVAKVTDDCFGTTWTDYLTLIKRDGTWEIIMKAFYDHANDRVQTI